MTEADMQQIQVPLTDFIREIVHEATLQAWKEHQADCPAAVIEARITALEIKVGDRIHRLELREALFLGYMVGAGVFGGGTAFFFFKAMMGA